MKRIARIAGTWALMLMASAIHAQSLEDQLRTQLREARSQLQDLQGQQAQWQAQQATAEQQRDQARKELQQAQAELAKLRGSSAGNTAAIATERADRQRAEAEAQRVQKAYGEATAKAQQQDAQNATLTTQWNTAKSQLGTCTAKNQQLYAIGNEILDAYAHLGFGTVLKSRQPFAAAARVKLENAAQAYGDRLYEQHYDPHAAAQTKQP